MKKLLLFITAITMTLALVSCSGDSRLSAGEKMINDYLFSLDGAVLTDSHTDVIRPSADTLVTTDYVIGSYRYGGKSYDIAVNTVNGEIYDSSRNDEFFDACAEIVAERLGIAPGEYVRDCQYYTHVPAAEGSELTTSLGSVIPVGITDMEKFASDALSDENTKIYVKLAVAGGISDDRWSIADAGWHGTDVTVYGVIDGSLPSEDEFNAEFRNSFTGVILELTADETANTTEGVQS